ncbi:hypothetical protein Mal15_38600 [Stieleria maiorica]|uniref:Uncharacterized protein n=1 Tax=Stieleria maiorica TaxID=2795974 RepID=A0A5B9MG20_9BACT|nr:hypothetical protein [Stieleria maiorica]QEF99793.1 hypothetical protein Mal15_38600 [Stieleria maiorica]
MTEQQWETTDDAILMIGYIWGVTNDSRSPLPKLSRGMNRSHHPSVELHRYYLACCRSIWPLLPQKASRRGIELAELWVDGKVSNVELNKFNYYVEGAAFNIDYNTEPDSIEKWIADVRANDSYRHLLHPPAAADRLAPREILKRAAYFADYAMVYPSLRPEGPPPETYRPFLSAELLRRFVAFDDISNSQAGS